MNAYCTFALLKKCDFRSFCGCLDAIYKTHVLIFTIAVFVSAHAESETQLTEKQWVDPFNLYEAYIKSINSDPGDALGLSVAISGDTAVVGAPGEASISSNINMGLDDNAAFQTGAAYIFVRDASGSWEQQAYLKANNADAEDAFGASVAISGDTVVVGALLEDSGSTVVNTGGARNDVMDAGAAYVFIRDSSDVWHQQAYLKAPNPDPFDLFGISVAISGDTVVVGAHNEDSNSDEIDSGFDNNVAPNAGAAYVFSRDRENVWRQQGYLKALNSDPDDGFGFSVSISGNTIVIGASKEDSRSREIDTGLANNDASFAGAAYVFTRQPGSVWQHDAYLKASNSDRGDSFGGSVAIYNDTIVVGARGEESSSTEIGLGSANNDLTLAGAAYVFARDAAGVWSQAAYLKPYNAEAYDYFGDAVAVSGNLVSVGALAEDSSSTQINSGAELNDARSAGAAYVFARNESQVWTQISYLKAPNANATDMFSSSVAIEGETMIIGAPQEDSNSRQINGNLENNDARNAGGAYIFRMRDRDEIFSDSFE